MEKTDLCFCDTYNCLLNRIKSFDGFPTTSSMHKIDLAKSGFYYTKTADVVACHKCDLAVSSWCLFDCAFSEHFAKSPNCTYLQMYLNSYGNKYSNKWCKFDTVDKFDTAGTFDTVDNTNNLIL